MLDAYYDGTLALDPLTATSKGDHRFNSEFPNYLSKSYKDYLMKIRLQKFSFRFAEQVLNSKLALKQEIESI